MEKDVETLINTDFEEIKSSSLSLLLLKTYSCLYANGKSVGACERLLKKYYYQLKKNGLKMAKEHVETKKTYILIKELENSLIYLKGLHKRKDSFSDVEVLKNIELGYFKKEWYVKLPEVSENQIEKKRVPRKNKKAK